MAGNHGAGVGPVQRQRRAVETGLRLGAGQLARPGRIGLRHPPHHPLSAGGPVRLQHPLGLPALRRQLQQRLRQIDIHVEQEQILTTNGGDHALDLLARALLKPGDTVLVESPGYYNLFNLLKFHGIDMLAVPRAGNGPDLAALEAILARHRPKCLFINSLFHNPTGTCLTPAVAHRLLQLAEAHDFLIVEDDIYADFQNHPGVRLAALDSLRRVIYVSSFSKTLSCSLRVGYVLAQPELVRQLANIKMYTGIGTQRFAECVVAQLLSSGAYRKLTQRLRLRLNRQMAATLQTLEANGWQVFAEPQGGMFVWARTGRHSFEEMQAEAAKRASCCRRAAASCPAARTMIGCGSMLLMPAMRGRWGF